MSSLFTSVCGLVTRVDAQFLLKVLLGFEGNGSFRYLMNAGRVKRDQLVSSPFCICFLQCFSIAVERDVNHDIC